MAKGNCKNKNYDSESGEIVVATTADIPKAQRPRCPECGNVPRSRGSEWSCPVCGKRFQKVKRNVKFPRIDFRSWFYENCKKQRRHGAKICQECPFRQGIEDQEAEAIQY